MNRTDHFLGELLFWYEADGNFYPSSAGSCCFSVAERDEHTRHLLVCVRFLGGGMGEFIKMCFVEHHSREETLSIPDQVSRDCCLSQADTASVAQ